jgi:FtsP/CotA-like multicopper oxidase with cupredoxin domain
MELHGRRIGWGAPAGVAIGLSLVLVAFLTAWPGLAGGRSPSSFHPIPHLPFSQPRVIVSHGGVLDARLVAEQRKVMVSGDTVLARVYDGSLTGPTLVVKPGDVMRITLVNHLDQPTNLHFHGMQVSPSGKADNVFREVEPGKTAQYVVRVPDEHSEGLFWYHAHVHHLVEDQVFGGLSGMLLVDGLTGLLPKPLRTITQRMFALRDIQVQGDAVRTHGIDYRDPTTRLVNNLVDPNLAIRPGETQLWRFANIGADVFYALSLTGVTFHVVAEDGRPVWHVWDTDRLVLPPGKRYEVLVQGPNAGTYQLKTLRYDEGFATFPTRILATLRSKGSAVEPAALPVGLVSRVEDLTNAKVARQRTEVFSVNFVSGAFQINGKSFSPNRVDVVAHLGTVEEWILVNSSPEQHPFHTHTDYFQVMSVNGTAYNANGRQDTVIIPSHGSVVIRVEFEDFTGLTVFHCHILAHEDGGMMATLRVVK